MPCSLPFSFRADPEMSQTPDFFKVVDFVLSSRLIVNQKHPNSFGVFTGIKRNCLVDTVCFFHACYQVSTVVGIKLKFQSQHLDHFLAKLTRE